jgi:hypothetical protein
MWSEINNFLDSLKPDEFANATIAFTSVALTILTYFLLRETAKVHHANQSADIIVSFELHPQHLTAINLVVENVGLGIAKDLRLELINYKPILCKDGESKSFFKLRFFNKVIPLFKSKQRIVHFAFMYHELVNPEDINFQVKAIWKDYRDKTKKQISNISLSFMDGVFLGQDSLYTIAKSQEKIAKSLEKIANGNNRLKVETITSAEVEKITKERIAQMQKNA